MLTSLRIQNFRSIRDASVKLGQVNLFIGPNNSGKSNFLKGVNFLADFFKAHPNNFAVDSPVFDSLLPRGEDWGGEQGELNFSLAFNTKDIKLHVPTTPVVNLVLPFSNQNQITFDYHPDTNTFMGVPYRDGSPVQGMVKGIRQFFLDTKVYKLEPAVFELSTGLSDEPTLNSNGANIASFLNTLSQNHEGRFSQLKKDFASCVSNLVSVSTPPDPKRRGNLKLKFFDISGNSYWAEEVSEGVLYFLALLCIVHQPNPPKLLLLEEPETGIHPRRIREILDFIFELARLRGIQIILTSHSPYVVDYFADITECISIFDRDLETGETLIKNAGEYIEQTNEELKKKGFTPISYTDSLGEYWVSGFLGGVPLNNL